MAGGSNGQHMDDSQMDLEQAISATATSGGAGNGVSDGCDAGGVPAGRAVAVRGEPLADEWQWWRDAMAGANPPIDANSPQSGFYAKRDGKNGKRLPVMIRRDETGKLRCRVGSDSTVNAHDVWTWCAGHPVSKEAAKIAFDTGSFPGEVELPTNGAVSLAEQIADYAATALQWLNKSGIKDKQSSDIAANYRAELLRLSKEADQQRDQEKRPHDNAAKAVQAKWKPVIDEAVNAADTMRAELTKWMRAEEARIEAERRAKWLAEQKAADEERQRIQAERAKQMRDDPIQALTSPEPELPQSLLVPMPPPEPVKINAGGQRGRATGLRSVTKYVVKDHAAALAFFAESDDVRELVQKLADRAGKAGVSVPGVEKTIEKVAS